MRKYIRMYLSVRLSVRQSVGMYVFRFLPSFMLVAHKQTDKQTGRQAILHSRADSSLFPFVYGLVMLKHCDGIKWWFLLLISPSFFDVLRIYHRSFLPFLLLLYVLGRYRRRNWSHILFGMINLWYFREIIRRYFLKFGIAMDFWNGFSVASLLFTGDSWTFHRCKAWH